MAKGQIEETVIAHGVRIKGDFTSQGDVLIEGEIHGSVKTASDLRIGESSLINATVDAKNAVIAGTVQGNVTVTGRLELLETANIIGDVKTDVLSMAAGANVNGCISMQKDGLPIAKKEEIVDEEDDSEE